MFITDCILVSFVFNLYVSIIDCKNYQHPAILMDGINDKHPANLTGGTSGPQPNARILPVKLSKPHMVHEWMHG